MSKEDRDQIVYQLLRNVCWCVKPRKELKITITPGLELQPGEIAIRHGKFGVAGSKDEAIEFGNYIRNVFGIRVEINVPDGHVGICEGTVEVTRPIKERYPYVSPWFLDWYCRSTLIQPEIKSLVAELRAKQHRSWIYRGEDSEYPAVRSTLSRHWSTTDPDAIKKIKTTEHGRLRRFTEEKTDQEMGSLLQHLGGKSNLIDFSGLIWIAAYFACDSEPENDGRVWSLDISRKHKNLTVSYPEGIQEEVARQRMEKQLGVMVESPSGIIDPKDLKKIATIPAGFKPRLLDFLDTIGISKQTLFPDIFAHIDDTKSQLSLEAFIYMLCDWIKKGEIKKAWTEANFQVENSKDDEMIRRGCMYYRGLAYAFSGDIDRAHEDIKTAREMFTDGVPKILDKNLSFIKSALKSRDSSRLKRQLHLDTDERFWCYKLRGTYKVVSI